MQRDRVPYVLLASALFVYVALRAVLVPLVHDESASILWYVFPGEWLPWRAHADANNHFISSAIGIVSSRWFGLHVWSLRAGSVTAFVLYAWGCWRLGSNIATLYVRWCLWAALLCCPFLLDFFSLFRGYGIELAGWVIALDGAIRYVRSVSVAHLVQAMLGSIIGTAAIVALVPAWAILLGLLVLRKVLSGGAEGKRNAIQNWSVLLLSSLALGYAVHVAMGMKEAGLLYYGSTKGFISVSVGTLSEYVLGTDAPWALGAVILAAVVGLCVHLVGSRWRGALSEPGILLGVLLFCDVAARVALAHLSGVNFPEDRAGLHFVPVFLMVVAFAIDKADRWDARARWVATVFLFLPLRTMFTANVDHTLIWAEQSIPARWNTIARAEEHALGRPVVIGGYHQLALSWPLAAQLRGEAGVPLYADHFPSGEQDLRIVDTRFLAKARAGYTVIDSATGPGLWLLRRDPPLTVVAVDTVRTAAQHGDLEFAELAHIPDTLLRAGAVYVAVRSMIAREDVSPDVGLVYEVNDSAGNKLLYDRLPLCVLRARWKGEELHCGRTLPRMPSAVRAVVYLHDPGRHTMTVGASEVIIGTVR